MSTRRRICATLDPMPRRAHRLTLQRLLTVPRLTGHPAPGFFRVKLVRGGPWVPALIWRPCPMIIPELLADTPAPEDWCLPTDRSRPLRARVGEREADPGEVWISGIAITPREYYWRFDLIKWAVESAPHEPEAKPRQAVDLTRSPALF